MRLKSARAVVDASKSTRAVATFEATEAVASVVFRTVASVKTITLSSRILHLTATIAVT